MAVDADRIFELAVRLATSFSPERSHFEQAFTQLLDNDDACMMVAGPEAGVVGYLLAFAHQTFFADGPVGWVEEIMVDDDHRRGGVGRALMAGFETWSVERGCRLVALATQRAAEFYTALGYQESATYFRKAL